MYKCDRRLIASAAWALAAGLLALPSGVAAQMMTPSMWVQRTPNYTMVLSFASPEQMVSPMSAMSSSSGEVMVTGGPMSTTSSMGSGSNMSTGSSMSTSSSSMPSGTDMMAMTMFDQGMPVNHHLEVHMTDNSGAVVNDVTPTIRITDKSTGVTRQLPDVMGMYSVQSGPSDFHYGQNIWLPDGSYNVTVMVGSDVAEFRDVSVSGGMGMPMMAGGT